MKSAICLVQVAFFYWIFIIFTKCSQLKIEGYAPIVAIKKDELRIEANPFEKSVAVCCSL